MATIPTSALALDFQFTLSGSSDNGKYSLSPILTTGDILVESIRGVIGGRFDDTTTLEFNPSNFPSGSQRRSLMAWIYVVNPNEDENQVVFHWGNSASANQRWVIQTGFLRYSAFDGQNGLISTPDLLASPNHWHHLCYTYDILGLQRLYVDGVEIQQSSISPNTQLLSSFMGSYNKSYNTFFHGYLNDVKIVEYGLLPSEVESYYRETSAFYSVPQNSLLLDYQFTASGSYDTGPLSNNPITTAGVVSAKEFHNVVGGYFDGSGESGLVFDASSLNQIEGWQSKTLMIWYASTNILNDLSNTIIHLGNSVSARQRWVLESGEGNQIIRLYDGGEYYIVNPYPNERYGWNHIACVFDNDQVHKIYHNGILRACVPNFGTTDSLLDTEKFHVGFNANSGDEYHGFLNDIKLYSGVLTDQEILTYYQSQSAIYQSFNDIPYEHLLLDYRFNVSGSYDHSKFSLSPIATTNTIEVNEFEGIECAKFTTNATLKINPSSLYQIIEKIPKTFMMWVRPNVYSNSDEGVFFDVGSDSSNMHVELALDSRYFRSTVEGAITVKGSFVEAGVWQHIAVTFDSKHMNSIYVNGQLESTDYTDSINFQPAYFAASHSGINIGNNFLEVSPFNGYLNDAKIWSVALTDEQINSYYQQTSALYVKENQLLLDYKFNLSGSYDNSPFNLVPTSTTGNIEISSYNGGEGGFFTGTEGLSFSSIDHMNIITAENPRTLILWACVLQEDSGSNAYHLAGYGETTDSNNNDSFGLVVEGNDIKGSYRHNSGVYLNGPTISLSSWHNYAFSLSGRDNIASLYIDGELVGKKAEINAATILSEFRIGERPEVGGENIFALINDVKLYNYCMSQNEIRNYVLSTSSAYPSS